MTATIEGTARRAWRVTHFLLFAFPPPAIAHGFGQRFDLPLPLWLWVAGAGASIVLSFLVTALFLKERYAGPGYPRLNLLRYRVGRALVHPALILVLRVLAVAVFLLTILAGFFGTPDPFRNIAPTMIWVVWWVGFAFVCALVGDLWALVNPLRTLFAWAEAVHARLRNGGALSRNWRYPRSLGVWPSAVVLLGFAWTELLWVASDVPFYLAVLVSLYACFTWAGMFVYGREVWLQNAEAFSVVFGVFARFAPLEVRVTDASAINGCNGPACRARVRDCVGGYVCLSSAAAGTVEWNLRPPGVGLLNDYPVHVSMLVFVLVMLSTVTFDGLLETPLWLDTTTWLAGAPGIVAVSGYFQAAGMSPVSVLSTLALLVVPAVFLAVYACFSGIVARVRVPGNEDSARLDTGRVACSFVLTLVPIAIAYHLAHYLSLLLTSGQFIIALASDPFGAGWNLWGTAGYQVDFGIVGARFVWYTAVIAIVTGHVFSVYLAHVVAIELFAGARRALVSQIPMVALMVVYTMVSLWILAQPIVAG